jgi:hypothetical protein
MERLDGRTAFEWIEGSVDRAIGRADPKAHFVSECVPPQFPRYVKLLHPFYQDGLRIRWRDVARDLGLEFAPEITTSAIQQACPRGTWPVGWVVVEGSLEPPDQLARFARLAEPWTEPDACFFYWSSIFRDEPMWSGHLSDLSRAHTVQKEGRSPNYAWPQSRVWCLCTDYDLTFTLIGCPEGLAESLLRDDALECIAVEPGTRIDRYAYLC